MLDLKGFLALAFLGLLDLSPGMSIGMSVETKDKPFNAELIVSNKTVTCSGVSLGNTYGVSMYTCDNIRVEGFTVFYGMNDYNIKRSNEDNNNGCPECPCGPYQKEPNDIYLLCAAMLAAQGVKQPLVAAYAQKPVCTQAKEMPRIKYFIVDGKPKWRQSMFNNGYINRLQCLVDHDR